MSKDLHDQCAQHPQRSIKYTPDIWSKFNFDGICYPTPFSDIKIFERKNQASVNVYGLEHDLRGKVFVYPIRITQNFVQSKHFDLL